MMPAYRIETPRLVIRCWDPTDAPLLAASINESLEHLRPWMPWALHEPEPVEAKAQRLRRFRADFDSDRDYIYGIFSANEKEVLGGCGLHARSGDGSRDIGYWINVRHIGNGLATETTAALTRVAFEVHRVQRIEIHCDSKNTRSAAVPRKLGFTLDATLRQRLVTPEGSLRDTMIWSLMRDELPETPVANMPIRAFDALTRRIV
jgi:RimJ/RimL family protein N-acetyltransferase